MQLWSRLTCRGAGSVIAAFALSVALALAPGARAASGGEARGNTVVALVELPPEARDAVKLIRGGGPFAYERDGVVFGNFEKLLPRHERGYYREYTVVTPGVRHRGARRIVAGRGGELYYTDDHYRSFKRIRE